MSVEDSRILVTGGAGFVGSHLVEALIDRGAEPIVADDFSRGRWRNVSHLVGEAEVRPVDLTRGAREVMEDIDQVFHLAASVGGIHYINREKIGGLTPSVRMTLNVLDAAARESVDRLLFASSACVYRQEHSGLNRFSEPQAYPANPQTTYGWAKILGEIAGQAYHEDSSLDVANARIFNAYGPRESLDPRSSHVIPSLCRKVVEAPDGTSVSVFGDGRQERGFIYVEDLVEGLIRAIDRKADAEPVNLGNASEVVTIDELANRIVDISGKDLDIEHDDARPTGTDRYCADTTRMTDALGWEPQVGLADGLERTFEWVSGELAHDTEQLHPSSSAVTGTDD